MYEDTKEFIKTVFIVGLIITSVIIIGVVMLITPTFDYSDIEAQVKVQEVGTRYAVLNLGEQQYIRVQNAYSEQYSASSESWETCIDEKDIKLFKDEKDIKLFKDAKDNRTTINIRVKGNGMSTIFTCLTGDKVVEIRGN